MSKILVTGSSGMIGFHLLKQLSQYSQHELYGIDKSQSISNSFTYSFERFSLLNTDSNIIFYHLDLCDPHLSKIISDINPDIIIHLAADAGISESFKNPQKILYNNTHSFINLLEAIRTTNPNIRLLYASSSSVYGKTSELQIETNNHLSPTSSYGLSKLMNEQTAELYFQNYGIVSIGLRFFTVYGEYNRKDMLMHYLLDSFHSNKQVTLYNNGLMKRDFTYVGDVVNSIIAFTKDNNIKQHEIFNIGGTGSSTLNEVVDLMQSYFNSIANIKKENFIPLYDPLKTYCDNKKLLTQFPDLTFLSLDEGINRLVTWYKNFK